MNKRKYTPIPRKQRVTASEETKDLQLGDRIYAVVKAIRDRPIVAVYKIDSIEDFRAYAEEIVLDPHLKPKREIFKLQAANGYATRLPKPGQSVATSALSGLQYLTETLDLKTVYDRAVLLDKMNRATLAGLDLPILQQIDSLIANAKSNV